MFPCYEQKLRWDDYGEIIRTEDWADTKLDDEKVSEAGPGITEAVLLRPVLVLLRPVLVLLRPVLVLLRPVLVVLRPLVL
jgi:hypothetical protein